MSGPESVAAGQPAEQELPADRSCGSCNVCCVIPSIDDPELQKLPGQTCRNARSDHSCAIYAARPRTCRSFFCGWRRLAWIDHGLRPDVSGVFVRRSRNPALLRGSQSLALTFTLLNRGSLEARGLLEAIAEAVRSGYGTWLIVPGPPGHTSCRVQLDEALAQPLREADSAAMRRIVTELYDTAVEALPQTRPMSLGGDRA